MRSLVVYYFMANSLATVVRVSIKNHMGQDLLGIYSTVASPTVIVQLLASVVFSPFLPLFAKAYNSGNKKLFSQYIKKDCSMHYYRIYICKYCDHIVWKVGIANII